ncbi:restriction modification system DNA specificity subunit [Alicycliphilus sp. B1]|nr:restriction modification system DNA specificity subunit [Alicycliphilus sp. B1]
MVVCSMRKQTAVGLIPRDWDIKQLTDVAQIRSGVAKNSNMSVSDPVEVHYLRVANVQDGFLDLSEMSRIEISRQDVTRYAVLPGDVLMNEGGDLDKLGRGSIWRGQFDPCIHQNHVFVVRCGPTLTPEYLSAWSRSAAARRYFMLAGKQTTNLASINKTALGELPIATPSLPEQRAIATALSDVDALIDGLAQLIAKKRDLKQAAMQQLLTGQTRLPGFSGEWEVKRLSDHLTFLKNGVNSRAELTVEGKVKYLHYGDIHGARGLLLNPNVTPMPHLPLTKAARLDRLSDGDLVFADASEDLDGVGKSVELSGLGQCDVVSGLHTIAIRFDKQVLADEFKAYLQFIPTFRRHLRRLAAGTKVYATNRAHISSAEVRLPKVDEQVAIATVLSNMDAELAALDARLAKTRALKQAMMQELLTGKTRLI